MSFYDQGKRDGKKGKRNPPPKVGIADVIAPKKFVDRKRKSRENYERGWDKGRRG